MAEVTITYCLPCRYQSKALQDADAILRECGDRLAALRLVPGDHGVYDVTLDGELVFSLDQAGHFPETNGLVEIIEARLPPPAPRAGRTADPSR